MRRILLILILALLIGGATFHHRSVLRRQIIMSTIVHDTIIEVRIDSIPGQTIIDTFEKAAANPDTQQTVIASPDPAPGTYALDTPTIIVQANNPKLETLVRFQLMVTIGQNGRATSSQMAFSSRTKARAMAYKMTGFDAAGKAISYTAQQGAYIPTVTYQNEPYGLLATVSLKAPQFVIDAVPDDQSPPKVFRVMLWPRKFTPNLNAVKAATKNPVKIY